MVRRPPRTAARRAGHRSRRRLKEGRTGFAGRSAVSRGPGPQARTETTASTEAIECRPVGQGQHRPAIPRPVRDGVPHGPNRAVSCGSVRREGTPNKWAAARPPSACGGPTVGMGRRPSGISSMKRSATPSSRTPIAADQPAARDALAADEYRRSPLDRVSSPCPHVARRGLPASNCGQPGHGGVKLGRTRRRVDGGRGEMLTRPNPGHLQCHLPGGSRPTTRAAGHGQRQGRLRRGRGSGADDGSSRSARQSAASPPGETHLMNA